MFVSDFLAYVTAGNFEVIFHTALVIHEAQEIILDVHELESTKGRQAKEKRSVFFLLVN